jgi:hypothetical protein
LHIAACYYGLGNHFVDVTELVAGTLAKPDAFFFVGPKALQTDPYPGLQKFLLLTYFSNGVRQYYTASDGDLLNREILLENASLGTDIYTRLYRETLQMRLGKAPPDFILTVATWPDGWAKTIGQFLGGVVDEKVLFASAQTSDFEPVAGQLCEAYYFAGMMRLMNGDEKTARQYFQKSLATGIKDYNEYRFAAAELVRLDDAAATTSSP